LTRDPELAGDHPQVGSDGAHRQIEDQADIRWRFTFAQQAGDPRFSPGQPEGLDQKPQVDRWGVLQIMHDQQGMIDRRPFGGS
jgi:hypothetical protein